MDFFAAIVAAIVVCMVLLWGGLELLGRSRLRFGRDDRGKDDF